MKTRNFISVLTICLFLLQTVSAITIDVTVTTGTGPGSLPNAVTEAADMDVINIVTGLGTITLDAEIPIDGKNIVIEGNDNTITTAEPRTSGYRLFNVTAGSLSIKNVTLKGGDMSGGNGGTININGENASLSLIGVTLASGMASKGAAVYYKSKYGQLNVTNCYFRDNYSKWSGGAITAEYSSSVTILDSRFSNNKTVYMGAITNVSSTMYIGNCSFVNCYTDGVGGAVYNDATNSDSESILTIVDSYFGENYTNASYNNGTFGSGGAVFSKGTLTLENSTFYKNYKKKNSYWAQGGGAIFTQTPSSIINCTFVGNYVVDGEIADNPSSGGAVFAVVKGNKYLNNIFVNNYVLKSDDSTIGNDVNDNNTTTNPVNPKSTGSNNIVAVFGGGITPDQFANTIIYTNQPLFGNMTPSGKDGQLTLGFPLAQNSIAIGTGIDTDETPAADQWGTDRAAGTPAVGAIESVDIGTGTLKNATSSDISIFPNPADDYIHIKDMSDIEIYNLTGKMLKRMHSQNSLFNISDLNTGIYIVRANNKNMKLIISR